MKLPGLRRLPPGPDRPVFVGGTGRSGTTVLGRLLGQHRELTLTFPMELTFFSDPGGLADTYVQAFRAQPELGRLDRAKRFVRRTPTPDTSHLPQPPELADAFVDRLRTHWFERSGPTGQPRGLHRSMDFSVVDKAAARYREDFPHKLLAASRALASELIDPMAAQGGTTRWVDTSPTNALVAHQLVRVFPDAKFIHMMRDGRDAAASVVTQMWGPDNMPGGIEWWRKRMIRVHMSMSRLPEGSGHVMQLEDLVTRDREGTIRELLRFLEVPDDPGMREWFDETVTPSKGNVGRWRRDYSGDQLAEIDDLYAAALADLDERGVPRPH